MVEGHCAKRYADDARQKCVGKRVVEIIWRADPRNEANVERCARGKRLNVDHRSSQGMGMPCNSMLLFVVAVVRTCGAIKSDSGLEWRR